MYIYLYIYDEWNVFIIHPSRVDIWLIYKLDWSYDSRVAAVDSSCDKLDDFFSLDRRWFAKPALQELLVKI